MGLWLSALGRLEVKPEVDDELIKDYVNFIRNTCPKGYREDEVFYCTWFFDSENRLISHAGKFAEPSVWYPHLKENFFEARGYELIGDPMINGEGDPYFWELEELKEPEYKVWRKRIEQMGVA